MSGWETFRTRTSLTPYVPHFALRAIGYADVRFGIHAFAVTSLSGTNLDSASALAMERAARRGELWMGE